MSPTVKIRDVLRVCEERIARHDQEQPGYGHAWVRLQRALLEIGGWVVVPGVVADPMVWLLPTFGELHEAQVRVVEGAPNRCHVNVVRLWRAGEVTAIRTGYALDGQGMWWEHAWGVGEDGAIVETTVRREAYFGWEWPDEKHAVRVQIGKQTSRPLYVEWYAGMVEAEADREALPGELEIG